MLSVNSESPINAVSSHLIKNADNILLVGHVEPDGDTIGSLLAMGLSLKKIGKNVFMYEEDTLPPMCARLFPSANLIKNKIDDVELFDTVIFLDCASLERAGKAFLKLSEIKTVINIDHHITNPKYGDFYLLDKEASSTGEIVFKLLSHMNIKLTYEAALAIYTAIITDTGAFRYSSANKAAFEICAKLIDCGVEPYRAAKEIYETYPIGHIRLIAFALNSIELSKNKKVGILTLNKKMFAEASVSCGDEGGLIGYVIGIDTVALAVLIKEKEIDCFDVSLRSNGSVDVSEIAVRFGGGGHVNAAGFSIKLSLSELKEKIFALSEEI